MNRLGSNPAALRSTARLIRAGLGDHISNQENDFLTKLERFGDNDQFSTRQGEYLWSLRERTTRTSKQGGYIASHLVQKIWEARSDLPYEDEERLEPLYLRGSSLLLSRSQWRWIFALCRELNLIENEFIEIR